MDKTQIEALAQQIQQQCPMHNVLVMQTQDGNQEPNGWCVAVSKDRDFHRSLYIGSKGEWEQALLAWDVLRD
jgi:hypothetical protein